MTSWLCIGSQRTPTLMSVVMVRPLVVHPTTASELLQVLLLSCAKCDKFHVLELPADVKEKLMHFDLISEKWQCHSYLNIFSRKYSRIFCRLSRASSSRFHDDVLMSRLTKLHGASTVKITTIFTF